MRSSTAVCPQWARSERPLTRVRTVETVGAWLLVSAALVLFTQAGFTALESGLVRSKSSVNVAIKNFVNFLVAAALFWLFGFVLMFGDGGSGLVGGSHFLFDSDQVFLAAFFLFELGFIGTATTLVSGAVAERMRFAGYLALATVVAALVYPIFGHWACGDATSTSGNTDGWLREVGFIDFAGSTGRRFNWRVGGHGRDHHHRPADRAFRTGRRANSQTRPPGHNARCVRALDRVVRVQRRSHARPHPLTCRRSS
jgi:Ammonium Transporter Family